MRGWEWDGSLAQSALGVEIGTGTVHSYPVGAKGTGPCIMHTLSCTVHPNLFICTLALGLHLRPAGPLLAVLYIASLSLLFYLPLLYICLFTPSLLVLYCTVLY